MSILVVGSVAFDSVHTPLGKREKALGGSANFFSISASYFTNVRLVGVVGEDFPEEHITYLKHKHIDTAGLQKSAGKTFHWTGHYMHDLNEAETLSTDLNVFATFDPQLPESYLNSDIVFLANIDPELQLSVLSQVKNPKLTAMDTMNFWIQSKKEALMQTISKVGLLFINEAEAKLLTGAPNVVKAAQAILQYGPHTVVIKRGEYGALLFRKDDLAFTPALPLADVFDPTGAGDTFAGGFLGLIDRKEAYQLQGDVARQALFAGTAMASLVVQDFSFDAIRDLNPNTIVERWNAVKKLSDVRDDLRMGN
jgi:sugar/nucleoside kinase (ribokinase family)